MKHTFYATKDIWPGDTVTAQTKPVVKAGAVLMTIETDLEIDRAIAATQNGAASTDKPKTVEEKKPA